MRTIIIALALLASTAASAQLRDYPRTVRFVNNATQELIATATYSGNRIYFRDKAGEHFATVVHEDGTVKAYDPHGKPIDVPDILK